ncbi:MAG: hypothetical protein IJT42_09540 [Treponema sp.]|nr:hypothetical protein [Treponema sp.]
MKKFFVLSVIFLLFLAPVSAMDTDFFVTAGPNLMVNTQNSTKSAPSPIMYSLGLGGDFRFENMVLAQVHGSFFTNYYLWDGSEARPAEVENRTATVLSFMLDFTGGYSFCLGQSQKHLLSLSGGLAFLFRHGFLSNGVSSDDPNRDTGSRASDDVSDINGRFFSDLNFLYPEFLLSYSYILSPVWKIGGDFRIYLPLGPLTSGRGADGMIFSLALKLSYK